MSSIFNDPNAPIGGWLRDRTPEEEDGHASVAVSKPKPDTREAVQKATAFFHKTPEGNEPDWAAMLLAANNQTEKFKIRAAREAYAEEKQFQLFQKRQDEQKAHIATVLSSPNRNKFFYEALSQNDPKTYYSVQCQRQMKSDKAVLGLGWFLKGPSK